MRPVLGLRCLSGPDSGNAKQVPAGAGTQPGLGEIDESSQDGARRAALADRLGTGSVSSFQSPSLHTNTLP